LKFIEVKAAPQAHMTHLLNFSECCASQDETMKAIAIIREALRMQATHTR
jgi:hypothetical protein